jgi:hypothetical protein
MSLFTYVGWIILVLAQCQGFTLINEHDEVIYDMLFSLLIMMIIL